MLPPPKGRGAGVQPANPYVSVRLEEDLEHVAADEDYLAELGRPPTEYLPDAPIGFPSLYPHLPRHILH